MLSRLLGGFLLPRGTVFLPLNTQLFHSFFGSTANSIQFGDGVEFSAIDLSASPLLTVSVPVGLQFGQTPAPIQVNGTEYHG